MDSDNYNCLKKHSEWQIRCYSLWTSLSIRIEWAWQK